MASKVTKKLINNVDECVDDALKGFAAQFPALRVHTKQRFTTRVYNDISNNVSVLSGGGSGHEPFTAGYVGNGMLDGSVSGSVFASPPSAHILHGIRHLHAHNKGGVLVVVPNYTGDRLNFGMAVEKAKNLGLKVIPLIVGEDLASGHNSSIGRRGMCGLVFIYKISGALASEGKDIETIHEIASRVLNNMATLGVSLTACSLPGQPPLFHVENDEMEIGTGVHGEAGIKKTKLGTAKEVVGQILEKLVDHLQLDNTSSVAVLINNLGATSQIEQSIVCAEVYEQLYAKEIKLERLYAGHIMSSLDMQGVQICILRLQPGYEKEWLHLLDLDTTAPSWPGRVVSPLSRSDILVNVETQKSEDAGDQLSANVKLNVEEQDIFKSCLKAIAKELIIEENNLNTLDAGCGDGDCGTTLKHLAEGILNYADTTQLAHPSKVLRDLSELAETLMGGTSGALYSLGFAAASQAFLSETKMNPSTWAKALQRSVEAISKYGGAKRGDRTMVDTLVPAYETFLSATERDENLKDALSMMIEAAEKGCRETVEMKARAGRACYVNESHLTAEDAGARGVVVWLQAVTNIFSV